MQKHEERAGPIPCSVKQPSNLLIRKAGLYCAVAWMRVSVPVWHQPLLTSEVLCPSFGLRLWCWDVLGMCPYRTLFLFFRQGNGVLSFLLACLACLLLSVLGSHKTIGPTVFLSLVLACLLAAGQRPACWTGALGAPHPLKVQKAEGLGSRGLVFNPAGGLYERRFPVAVISRP